MTSRVPIRTIAGSRSNRSRNERADIIDRVARLIFSRTGVSSFLYTWLNACLSGSRNRRSSQRNSTGVSSTDGDSSRLRTVNWSSPSSTLGWGDPGSRDWNEFTSQCPSISTSKFDQACFGSWKMETSSFRSLRISRHFPPLISERMYRTQIRNFSPGA